MKHKLLKPLGDTATAFDDWRDERNRCLDAWSKFCEENGATGYITNYEGTKPVAFTFDKELPEKWKAVGKNGLFAPYKNNKADQARIDALPSLQPFSGLCQEHGLEGQREAKIYHENGRSFTMRDFSSAWWLGGPVIATTHPDCPVPENFREITPEFFEFKAAEANLKAANSPT